MLIYRLVSWIFISSIGWVVFFFMFRTEGALDPDAVVEELAGDDPPDYRANPDDPADTALQGPLPPPDPAPEDDPDR
jgi:hypothetical protein